MIQRKHSDYFERLTQDIAKFFAALIGKNIDSVEEELDQAYHEWLKLDRKSLDALNSEELLSTLLKEMNLDVEHIELVAEIFANEGELYFNKNQYFKSKSKLQNALNLFEFVDQEKQIFSFERQSDLQKIKKLIAKINLNYKNGNIKNDLR